MKISRPALSGKIFEVFLISVLFLLLCSVTLPAQTIQLAPAFELLSFDGNYSSSSQLFRDFSYTFLVFWDSGCPECVESLTGCEYFYNDHLDDNIAVVGIHMDTGRMSDAQAIVEENGITIIQLWDVGGEAAQQYEVPHGVFTVFLVDSSGRIVASRRDTGVQTETAMTEMLTSAPVLQTNTEIEPQQSKPDYKFTFHGDTRIRFLSVDIRGEIPSGPFGEDVRPGNDLLYRFELELSRRITRHVRVGGLLRISNEGEEVLEAGPKYLGTEWGSAFAELIAAPFTVRLGYYTIAMTPLTMMRWDWNDNPKFGGNAGCGCGATAGVLLIKSLEELGPDLVFEGGIATHSWRGLESRLFYGIPRRSDETGYLAWRSTGENRASYSLEIAGIESAWRRFDARTDRHWRAGARITTGWEDPRSVDFAKLGYPVSDPWYQSAVASVDVSIPLLRYVAMEGEWLAWNKTVEKGLLYSADGDRRERTANGGLAGIVLDGYRYFSARADYIRLDPGYFTPFSALSYIPNADGGRVSGKLFTAGRTAALSLFYKRLREISPPDNVTEKQQYSVYGISMDLEFPVGVGGSVGWMDEGTWRTGVSDPLDETRKSLFLGGRWRFRKTTHIELQYQRVDTDSKLTVDTGQQQEVIPLEGYTNLYSVYFRASF